MMARYQSWMKILVQNGHGMAEVKESTIAALDALAPIEERLGATAALSAALSAYLTTYSTIGAQHPEALDQAHDQLTRAVDMIRDIKAAFAEGRPAPGMVSKTVPIIGEPEGNA